MNYIKGYFAVREAREFTTSLDLMEQGGTFDPAVILQNCSILKNKLKTFSGKRIEVTLNQLNARVASLAYRFNILKPSEISSKTLETLKMDAFLWKADKAQFDKNGLTDIELKKLEEATTYADYAECLLADESLRESFFDWILSKGNTVRPIVEFPATTTKIKECMLAERIGFYGGDVLKVEGEESKILTLPFEGRRINILDPKEKVTFKTGKTFSIAQVFEIFKNRVYEIGDLEFFQEGILNWNPGKWDIELDSEKWWEQLPQIEQISVAKANERYDVSSTGKEWVFHVKASREHPSLDIEGTHSYLEIAIPHNGGYRIHYIGKFATEFPRNLWDYLNVITRVFDATLLYPDENIFNLHRQHEGHGALATDEEGTAIMQSIKKDILNAKKGNFKFQFITENCSHWVWKKLRHHLKEERIPNLFGIPFADIKARGFVGKFFEFIRSLPPSIRGPILYLIFLLVGGWRSSTVTKKNGEERKIGVLANPPWNPGEELLHPPCLFEKKSSLKK